jgi:4-hydroxybenzoate polyprenyltransferase
MSESLLARSVLIEAPPANVAAHESSADVPIILDLDGTLVRGNLLTETALALVRKNPVGLFLLLVWLFRFGRAGLKQKLAQAATVDVAFLPLNEELLAWASGESARGRKIYIASAADRDIAQKVALRVPFIEGVLASDGLINLKGPAKAAALTARFPQGFDYAGDARADLPVWRAARQAIVVEASSSTLAGARRVAEVTKVFPMSARWKATFKSLRPHQWAKNALVFVPLILSGQFSNISAVIATVAAFAALSLIASATYLINDIIDLPDDRQHWSKRNRPLASGRLSVVGGIMLVPAGLALGFAAAAFGGSAVMIAGLLYLVCTVTYSLKLKKLPILDGFALAALFTVRIGTGIVAASTPPSQWLLVFSMFLFASLSFAKRYTEVARVIERGGTEVRGRGYKAVDLPLILAIGVATGMCAVLIMVLYIIDDAFSQTFYGDTIWLWGFPICLFLFVCRIWLMCQRGEMNDDPVAFAVRDGPSLGLAAIMGICFAAAWSGVLVL